MPDYDLDQVERDWQAKGTTGRGDGERPLAATVDEPDPDVIDATMRDLATRRGEPLWKTEAQVMVLTAGERDCTSLARGIDALGAMRDSETIELSDVSAAQRQALAKKGHALPDGSYPIHDKAHLHAAAVLAASGHGNVAAARALIRKRARELGVDVTSLPGFGKGDEDENDKAAATHAALKRAGISDNGIVQLAAGTADAYTVELAARAKPPSAGLSPADAWLASLPGSGRTASQRAETDAMFGTKHPDGKVTTKTRAHSGQTSTHGEVDRLTKDYRSMGFFGREEPQTASESYGPRSPYPGTGPSGKPQGRG